MLHRKSIKYKLGALLATVYLYVTGITTRKIWRLNKEVKELDKNKQNYIYAIWHSQQAFLVYAFRKTKACALVSLSKDGEYIAGVLKKFGMKAVRGSTSRGASKAVLELIDMSKKGYHPVITPDGPRGPAKTVQSGALFLAKKTKLPIVPVACGLKNKIVFKSWDKFELPLPFGKSAIVYGNPITVTSKDSLKQKADEIQKELNRISELSNKLVS